MAEPKLYDLKTDLPLHAADRIIDAALVAGRAEDMLPLTVAVLDAGGHLVALKREDGSGILRADIATGKAWGALGMGIPSRTIGERLGQRPAFQGALVGASNGRFVPVPGGVLVLSADGQVIGAVGISGDTSDRDEYCAIQGIQAAGLASAPAEPARGWQNSGL
ncbi:MAG: heme-binding protein [Proteobacteria bacterium]|nr:heme-binding protein [Pseudomonadota bacterium]